MPMLKLEVREYHVVEELDLRDFVRKVCRAENYTIDFVDLGDDGGPAECLVSSRKDLDMYEDYVEFLKSPDDKVGLQALLHGLCVDLQIPKGRYLFLPHFRY